MRQLMCRNFSTNSKALKDQHTCHPRADLVTCFFSLLLNPNEAQLAIKYLLSFLDLNLLAKRFGLITIALPTQQHDFTS